MQGSWRLVGLVLLVPLVAALTGGQAFAFAAPARHSAGCHGRAPATPSPAPANFQCCVNGHHAAIPNATFSEPSMLVGGEEEGGKEFSGSYAPYRRSAMCMVLSNSPPGGAPLRI
jgi:hypothetical protein